MIMKNKLIILSLLNTPQTLLLSQENTEKYDHSEPIKISSLYETNLPENVNDESLKQLCQPSQPTNTRVACKPKEWILESSLENAPKLIQGRSEERRVGKECKYQR